MTASRPDRLVIAPGSQSVFGLKEAARDLCEIIWLVDLSRPEMNHLGRIMSRTGTLVDTSGLSNKEVIRALAAVDPTGVLNMEDCTAIPVAAITSNWAWPSTRPTSPAVSPTSSLSVKPSAPPGCRHQPSRRCRSSRQASTSIGSKSRSGTRLFSSPAKGTAAEMCSSCAIEATSSVCWWPAPFSNKSRKG